MLSTYGKNLLLGAFPEKPWVQLHTGDPGTEGKSKVAGESKRTQVTMAAASEGQRVNSSSPEWPEVSTTEEYQGVSYWDAESGGNFIGSAELETNKAMTKGDSFKFDAGDLKAVES